MIEADHDTFIDSDTRLHEEPEAPRQARNASQRSEARTNPVLVLTTSGHAEGKRADSAAVYDVAGSGDIEPVREPDAEWRSSEQPDV